MTIELTFNPADEVTRRSPVTARANDRHHDPLTPETGRDRESAQGWRAANRGVQRAENVFVAVLFVGLLALGTMTFGYAFNGVATAQAAVARAVAASE